MTAKTGRLNHDFQIAYFLAGKCHTPDGAYAMLFDLLADRKDALNAAVVSEKRARAARLRATERLESANAADRLDAEAELDELAHGEAQRVWLVSQAEAEVAFIQRCMRKIEPLRKYRPLPNAEAFEAAQREEWCAELVARAENYIACQGAIPHDEFSTMRAHPDFSSRIMPAIEECLDARRTGGMRLSSAAWSLPKLIGLSSEE